ncbi:Calvin cycle protein CP12 [Candidatus Synechococcus calcipolaris G9]|uniref:Calvin cycle protein CP12 n=1 Tax=Candidatus Synechococcus calcipolaris G9 TaxID=1497997 RepID=A0ABT6F2Z4_9SYNE|nr:Calvin cycle protein CP12 [Candidatus Synechococcus calcipolaris]MDG2992230.1 Calvin cycle protein CP12 [Candidatus Synechococcus calcipolaris G9]
MSNIEKEIEKARVDAREVCDIQGSTSGQCAAAWDALEELQAEASHQREEKKDEHRTSLEQYCDDNPDAAECRIYDD